MSTINTGPFVSHRRGGSITIKDNESTTVYTVSGEIEDSHGITPGMYALITDTESGQPVRHRRGDKQVSRIRLRFKQTQSSLNATSLYGLLLDQVKATDDGLMRTFDVTFRQTDHSGDATGETEVYATCAVVPGSLTRTPGAEYNTIEVELSSLDAQPAFSTF